MSRINTILHHTVYLGQGGIGDTLVITPSGGVQPTAAGGYGANAVVSDVAGGKVTNDGVVIGGYGGGTLGGGIGVDLQAEGTLINPQGLIDGGNGYGGYQHLVSYKNGGIGVNLQAGGAINNGGSINGGMAGYSGATGIAFGGNGVDMMAGGTLTNHGGIAGGSGGYGASDFDTGGGGVGVFLAAGGTVLNSGTIDGGYGGDNPLLYSGHGSNNGGVGVNLANGGTLRNAGSIVGGAGGYVHYGPGAGGAGISLTDATATNAGTITGGEGGLAYSSTGGTGGAGAVLQGAMLTNAGMITGGAGGGAYELYAGNGGVGVVMTGGTLVNNGAITGGMAYGYGDGGAGVLLNGGTLTNAGKIKGGAKEANDSRAGDAVRFGTAASTLVLDPGSVLHGLVVGDGSNDTLVLAAGKIAGTLAGLGSSITGITTINEAHHANWTLSGNVTLATGSTLNVAGALTVTDNAGGPGTAVIEHGGVLTVDGKAGVGEVQFAGRAAALVVGSPTAVSSTLSGFGAGDTIDLVKLLANGESFANGTLSLTAGGSVVATLALAGNYTSNDFTLTSDGNGGTTIGFTGGAPPHDFGWQDAAATPAFAEAGWAGAHMPPAEDWAPPLHVPAHFAGW